MESEVIRHHCLGFSITKRHSFNLGEDVMDRLGSDSIQSRRDQKAEVTICIVE